jgi:hypothetical protein
MTSILIEFSRWSVGSLDTSVFFSEGSLSRPGSTRTSNVSVFSSNAPPEVVDASKTTGPSSLPKKRSMAALRNSAVADQLADPSGSEDVKEVLYTM